MAAYLLDFTFVNDVYAVNIFNRTQSVGNDDRCATNE